jgi:hypothetical protein
MRLERICLLERYRRQVVSVLLKAAQHLSIPPVISAEQLG